VAQPEKNPKAGFKSFPFQMLANHVVAQHEMR
jgi:hypothetical protein